MANSTSTSLKLTVQATGENSAPLMIADAGGTSLTIKGKNKGISSKELTKNDKKSVAKLPSSASACESFAKR